MRWPAARITAADQRVTTRLLAFAAAELLLAMAIPFLLIRGYHTLLSSNAGTVVDAPTVEEPGWSAHVSTTPVTAVVEVVDGSVSGATVVVPPGTSAVGGGTVVLIPGDLLLPDGVVAAAGLPPDPGAVLSELDPASVGDVLARLLNVDLAAVEVMTETGWADVLGASSYTIDNPDPVPSAGSTPDQLAFAVGSVQVDADGAAVFLGRPVDGGSLSSVAPRRRQFWQAVLDAPPASGHDLAAALRVVGVDGRIAELPTIDRSGAVLVDEASVEALMRDVVAFPSGDRLEVRVVDRTGEANLEAIAAQLAGRGIEVVEIANAVRFDDGSTELIRPTDVVDGVEQLDLLADALGVDPIVDPEQEHDSVTLLVGGGFHLDD